MERWQALGNVYVVSAPFGPMPQELPNLAGEADGLLEVSPDGELVIWNRDGSRAEMSGNGTRIAAAWLMRRSGDHEVVVSSAGRSVVVRAVGDGLFEQELGEVHVSPAERLEGITFVPVDVGNPHAVVEGDPAELPRVGALLETHPRFPERTNVQVGRGVAPGRVEARVWERGVGETRSSGTGAVAVAAALTGPGRTAVFFPGGELVVRIHDGRASLVGRAERVG